MKLTALLISILLLSSCGGGGDNTGNETPVKLDPEKIYIKIVHSTGNYQYDGPPLAGVIVQIDHNGENKTSDNNGAVTFTINDTLQHDIHVFGQNGFMWHSIYSVKKGIINKIQLYNPDNLAPRPQNPRSQETSYLSFKVNIPNIRTDSSYKFYFYDTVNKRRYQLDNFFPAPVTGNDINVDFRIDLPVATSITGELIVMEYQQKKNEQTLIDSVIMSKINYLTSSIQDNNILQTVDLLKNNKLEKTEILTINNFKMPEGFVLSQLTLFRNSGNAFNRKLGRTLYKNDQVFVTPKTVTSYTSFDYKNIDSIVYGIKKLSTVEFGKQLSWSRSSYIPRYSVIDIIPKITVFPDFSENQSGDTLNWNFVNDNLTEHFLTILDIQTQSNQRISWWNISLNTRATMVQLPNIPAGITPLLKANTEYDVRIIGILNMNTSIESFELSQARWTRKL